MTGWWSHCARAFRPLTAVVLLLSLLPVPALPERSAETPKKCDSACCARKVHASCPHHKASAASREPGDGPVWKNAGACPRNCTNSTEAQRSFAMDGTGSAELWLSAAAFQLSFAAGRTPHANPLEYSLRQRPPPSFESPAFADPAAG